MLGSSVTFSAYRWDKRSAIGGTRRIPERALHALELLGGWPGALLAQRVLRHKSRKLSYQLVFWLVVALHAAYWLGTSTGFKLALH